MRHVRNVNLKQEPFTIMKGIKIFSTNNIINYINTNSQCLNTSFKMYDVSRSRRHVATEAMFPLDYSTVALRNMPDAPRSIFGHLVQSGEVTIFDGEAVNSLEIWEKQVKD